ncbi:hypothetical protein AWU65_21915 [Paenibacillus glucanolyticus]|uniref:N-acetyltransferase domain-containing protein n=1 Tax=Paenibacillus glucanolyticus TaxID=59843 RepID=A0A163LRW2_9BACL|nr:GNAT family N-acetyltransferase [Paenibacillus glucanolyticus]KZS48400.1 hypothetical protein AWU65_21915 [Paenibacillus glucanolyticus]
MEYRLVKADPKAFSKYFATYYKNIWFRPSWAEFAKILSDSDDGYWVLSGDDKAAGVYLNNESIGLVFGIPPYSITSELIREVKNHALQSWSLEEHDLHAYNVLDEQEFAFREADFVQVESRQCMIRPTEQLEASFDVNYIARVPARKDISELVEVFRKAYANGPDEREVEVYMNDTVHYFDQIDLKLLQASSLIYDRASEEMAGVCLISLWEGLPLVYSIAVTAEHRGKGLAGAMLERALTVLEPQHPLLRLFVTSGNRAEQLYKNKGFLSGGEYHHLKYTLK